MSLIEGIISQKRLESRMPKPDGFNKKRDPDRLEATDGVFLQQSGKVKSSERPRCNSSQLRQGQPGSRVGCNNS